MSPVRNQATRLSSAAIRNLKARVALMTRKLLSVLGVGLLAVALTGCSANDQIVRGQCPPSSQCGPSGGAGGGGGCRLFGGCAGGGNCGGLCGHGAGNPNGINLPFHPVHRNYVDYQVPTNLSYPKQNTPAATVQYPYYTLKGPSDFFMK